MMTGDMEETWVAGQHKRGSRGDQIYMSSVLGGMWDDGMSRANGNNRNE